MARAFRNCSVSFAGLINFDVKLFAAARDESSTFNQVHVHADGSVSKISQQNFCSGCNSVVPYSDLSKGVEVNKGQYAVVTPAELAQCLAPESDRIEITAFVALSEVDPVFFASSYYLAPETKKNAEGHATGYEVLYQLLKTEGKAGVATFTNRGKLHNVYIRVFETGLMLHTIFTSKEVRSVEEFKAVRNVTVNDQLLKAVKAMVKPMLKTFDPNGVVNQYEDLKDALIEEKKANPTVPFTPAAAPSGPKPSAADDLLAKLTASLHSMGVSTDEPAPAPAEAPKPKRTKKEKVAV